MCLCPRAVIKWQPCKASLASPNKTIFPRPCMWPLLRLVESCIWLEVAKTRETNKIDTCHPKWMLVRGADFKCQLLTRRAPCTHPRLHIGRRGVLMGRRVQREAWAREPGIMWCSNHNWPKTLPKWTRHSGVMWWYPQRSPHRQRSHVYLGMWQRWSFGPPRGQGPQVSLPKWFSSYCRRHSSKIRKSGGHILFILPLRGIVF